MCIRDRPPPAPVPTVWCPIRRRQIPLSEIEELPPIEVLGVEVACQQLVLPDGDIDPVLAEAAKLLHSSGRDMQAIAAVLLQIADQMEQEQEQEQEQQAGEAQKEAPWDSSELLALRALIAQYGSSNLLRVANAFEGRSRQEAIDKLQELSAAGEI
eukprot:TRINITY_DN2812_c0_g1_i3.p1 TRINITY_DN2812_c0_g1~~TRINITY_DN2812_c0_g1_i3.p1  ORF type:complete len:156 (-),score=53.99 TRINITY_DN2812_c0_g1_i3:104-571(-)